MEATDSASSSPEKSPAHEDDDMMSSLDDSYLESYGFNFQDTYRHVLKFYKENESKSSSSHLNYNDKNRLVAYTQQSAHGPLSEANVAPLGALDDRKGQA